MFMLLSITMKTESEIRQLARQSIEKSHPRTDLKVKVHDYSPLKPAKKVSGEAINNKSDRKRPSRLQRLARTALGLSIAGGAVAFGLQEKLPETEQSSAVAILSQDLQAAKHGGSLTIYKNGPIQVELSNNSNGAPVIITDPILFKVNDKEYFATALPDMSVNFANLTNEQLQQKVYIGQFGSTPPENQTIQVHIGKDGQFVDANSQAVIVGQSAYDQNPQNAQID